MEYCANAAAPLETNIKRHIYATLNSRDVCPRRSFTCVKPVFLLIASTKSIASVDGDFNMW